MHCACDFAASSHKDSGLIKRDFFIIPELSYRDGPPSKAGVLPNYNYQSLFLF